MSNIERRKKYMSDMNMTPMIDVMLVLLVVFMITAPMLVTGVDVNLPKTKKAKVLKENDKPIVVSINNKGEFYIGSMKIDLATLLEKLKVIATNNKIGEVFIKADKTIQYGRVVEAMGKIIDAGFEKVSLVTDLD